jgi:hypothetical protein
MGAGVELTSLDTGAPPVAGYWVLDAPAGHEYQGRYLLREPAAAPDNGTTDTTTSTTTAGQSAAVKSYVDVYVSGANVLTIHQGPSAAEQAPDSSDPTAQTASVDALGAVETRTALNGNTLIAHPASQADWFVHVSATVSLAELEQLAAPLHAAT